MHAAGGKSKAEEEAESRRGSCDSSYSTTSEREAGHLKRSKTGQSEATTRSGASRKTSSTSSSSYRERHPWAFPFGRKKSSAAEGDIFERSQQAAVERAARKDAKAAKKHGEKEKMAKESRQWPEHLGWFYGASVPGYFVI
ncbi:uncharacterized protein RHO25_002605 [Cercospora beticola]|uniref:Stress-associated endoplasmic reticulum protein n=1 Tax=Cercospora beticola TaxID=122368 RepID=A0ABZ0NEU6_CERBT|nr:hypothetical protein RHO25_002605 [Cercospora beticola]